MSEQVDDLDERLSPLAAAECVEDIYRIILALSPPDGTAEPLARAIVAAISKSEVRNILVAY